MEAPIFEVPGKAPMIQPSLVRGRILEMPLDEHNHQHGLESLRLLQPALAIRSPDAVIADLQRRKQHLPPQSSLQSKTRVVSDEEEPADAIVSNSINGDDASEDEDENVDSEDEELRPPIRKVSERRKAQNAKFQSYVENLAQQKVRASKPITSSEDERLSTTALAKQSSSAKIISSPREYQVELFERAKERNIIAVLPTGSGKTLIAVLLLQYMLEREIEDREAGKPMRIAFFLVGEQWRLLVFVADDDQVDSVTLVFQQFAVLEANLGYPMNRFCGDMGTDLWTGEIWEKHFADNMVIVLTADVLASCLTHGFISMDQINLLIFDEAHHAKKKHAYSQIIKDFYAHIEDISKRPKIFGMTASPVDARVNVKQAAAQLEGMLHCQIATPSKLSLTQYEQNKNREEVADYERLLPPFETPLYRKLLENFKGMPIFNKPLEFARHASSELGAWCADRVWPLCLTEEEAKKLEAKVERSFRAQKVLDSLEVLEAQIAQIQAARNIVDSHTFEGPQLSLEHLSPKVLTLATYLRECFERPTDDKCIVFVKQRYTARLLTELFSHPNIGTPHLRVGSLVGAKTGNVGDINLSFRQQLLTLFRFRKGHLNCLFATSVAEEGLDIPDCNLVIRFDLYTTLIQYIQSRGRARHINSKFIHMMEVGNKNHRELIKEVSKNEQILRAFCETLPENRLVSGNNFNMDYFLSKERGQRVYKEKETGAKLTYRMSLTVLENFVASLQRTPESEPHAEYIMTTQSKYFVCEVILPENSPIHGAVGRPATTKQVAKCAAAFEACLLLRQGGHLDAHLLSTYKRQQHIMRNAALAISSKKRQTYNMLIKPALWTANEPPENLYLTVIDVSNPEYLDRPSRPLGLLTREPLPSFPRFPIFFGKGRHSDIICHSSTSPLQVDAEMLTEINIFTLRVFGDVFSKEYQADIPKMSYFLVPLRLTDIAENLQQPSSLIDWEVINYVKNNESIFWDENTSANFFESRYIVDPFDGSRKLWSVKVAPQYKPRDPVPPNTAPRPGARKNNSNIMEYSCSLWAKSRERWVFKEVQPVIEAEYIPLRRNLLDDSSFPESEPRRQCFIILEALKISALPTFVVSMAYVFPAVIHRIESYLIALDACKMLHLDLSPGLALEAMTKDSDNTEDHDSEQIRFRRGMGRNYERLEFLGDSFLKMATSISLYTKYPDDVECDYHVKRMLMICNQNLFNNALDLKLYEYVRSQSFNRRVWYPTCLVLKKGKTASVETSHGLGDKTIADVCEALIGASWLSNSEMRNFDLAVRAVTELVCSTDHDATCFADYYKSYKKPKYQTAKATSPQKVLAGTIEAVDGYHFQHPRLLRSAFNHPSYPYSYEHVPNYQRLEFLGDALLDMACVNFLFHRFPNKDPQWLTEHKMAMVSNQFLGALCVSLGFHRHLKQFNSILVSNITEYVNDITQAKTEAEEEAVRNGKAKGEYARDFWIHTNTPPKCLPDMVEAYIGAMFVDSQYEYNQVERFFDMHIKPYFIDMNQYDTFANKHPVTFLKNLLEQRMGCRHQRIHATQMPDLGDGMPPENIATVMIHNEIVAVDQRASGRYAKVGVAEKALKVLEGMSLPDFRRTFRCDCKESDLLAMEVADRESLEDDDIGTAV